GLRRLGLRDCEEILRSSRRSLSSHSRMIAAMTAERSASDSSYWSTTESSCAEELSSSRDTASAEGRRSSRVMRTPCFLGSARVEYMRSLWKSRSSEGEGGRPHCSRKRSRDLFTASIFLRLAGDLDCVPSPRSP